MPRRGRSPSARAAVSLAVVSLLMASVAGAAGYAVAAPNPHLPIALDSSFVGNLTAPGLTSGASGTLQLTLTDPLPVTIHGVTLTLELYAFNAFPGNASSSLPLSAPPLLTTASSQGLWANFSYASLASGARSALSVGVVTSSTTAVGAYSVRTALAFTAPNDTTYRLASRGWFTQALWEEATEEPNGSAVLDNQSLTVLNISGVLPETSIQVTSTALDIALYAILGVVLVLVGIGAFFYFRRTSKSNSGAR